jgi:hypothetical protein
MEVYPCKERITNLKAALLLLAVGCSMVFEELAMDLLD